MGRGSGDGCWNELGRVVWLGVVVWLCVRVVLWVLLCCVGVFVIRRKVEWGWEWGWGWGVSVCVWVGGVCGWADGEREGGEGGGGGEEEEAGEI